MQRRGLPKGPGTYMGFPMMPDLSSSPARKRGPSGRWLVRTGWAFLLLACLGVAAYAMRYVLDPPQTPAEALGNSLGVPWLFVHVAASILAIVLGAFQFLPALRRGPAPPHRWIGRVYMAGCLAGGAAGLIVALGSSAGPIATAGFGGLAIAWISVNLLGWRAILNGQVASHRRWMIRSWALTLAAVTLRIYLPLLAISGLPFVEWYRAISFLCWVPNLLLAELWLRRRRVIAEAQPA